MAGVSPLFAALFVWLLTRERPAGLRAIGLALMAAGAFTLGAKSLAGAGAATWLGDALFICAAVLWACFSLAFRGSGLTAWQGAALVNAWSALLLAPWLIWRGGTQLLNAPPRDLLFQAAWQGVIAGVLGLWTFAVAIRHLGASQAAAFGALVPVVSALGGWWWLGDALGVVEVIAVVCAALGVALASGVLKTPLKEL
jgi:drug/metabolite transporter (DMT)-like permease